MMLLRHFLPSLVRICFICCRIFSICNVIYSRIFSSSDDLHMPCGVSITLKYREHMRPHCRVLRLAAWWDAALLTGCRHWLILIFTLFFSLLFPEHRVSFSSRNPGLVFMLCLRVSHWWPVRRNLLCSCAGSRRTYCLAPGRDDRKVLLNRRAGVSSQSADLPVTGLSLQLSATSTTAAIMQNNLISHLLASPTSADCPTRSPSPH